MTEMKKVLMASLGIGLSVMSIHNSATSAELRVTITGIQSDLGEIEVQAFEGEDGWLKEDHPGTKITRTSAADAIDGVLTMTISDLTPGEYALAIYHDENMSGELESGFMWRPKEGWAFSNNTKPRFGPPSYTKARLRVLDYGSTASVRLEYP